MLASITSFIASHSPSLPLSLLLPHHPPPQHPLSFNPPPHPLSLFLSSPPSSPSSPLLPYSIPAFSSLIGLFRAPCLPSPSSSSSSEGYRGFVWNTSPQRPHFNRLFILSLKQRMHPIGARVSEPSKGRVKIIQACILHHNRCMRNAIPYEKCYQQYAISQHT